MRIVVLGMHKSGTTLLAKALHHSGIVMGQEYPEDADYASVKFEARAAQAITDDILGLPRKLFSLEVTSASLPAGISEPLRRRMSDLVVALDSEYDDWGFKDPRAALTYRFWKHELGDHKVILVYRDPVEVWRRYARVDHKWWSRRAFAVWLDYNRSIIDQVDLADTGNVLVISFESLLNSDEEWRRLESFTGRQVVDVRDMKQSRFRVTDTGRRTLSYRLLRSAAGVEVRAMYERLETASKGEPRAG